MKESSLQISFFMEIKIFIIRYLFVFFLLIFFSCKTVPSQKEIEKSVEKLSNSFEIRVKLVVGSNLKIRSNDKLLIIDLITNRNLFQERDLKELSIKINEGKVYINDINIINPIKIVSNDGKYFVNSNLFIGNMVLYPKNNDFDLINIVPIELYLLSVVPSEVPSYFHIEALKAQAVIARTYTIYFLNRDYDRNYEVDNTTSFQVYNGFSDIFKSKYFKNVYNSVLKTNSEIIVYQDKPILAYFHSNSGGYISSGYDYFGSHSDFPYLVSKEDPYSIGYPGYEWQYKTTVENFFILTGIDLKKDYRIEKDEKTGFIKKIVIENSEWTPKYIRKSISYKDIKSEKFNIAIDGNQVIITGKGYGHGVGLSQWGAEGMARKGFKYKDIINFYYPETKLQKY